MRFFSSENLTFQEKPNTLRQQVFILAFLLIGANIIEFQGKKLNFAVLFLLLLSKHLLLLLLQIQ